MESIYYVVTWLCHRTCSHCYDDRFRPYYGDDLTRVVRESREFFPGIIANFPERMTYLDLGDPGQDGQFREKTGTVILAGGEVLLDAVRESVLYPALEALHGKYREAGGVRLAIQTTGDTLNSRMLRELRERHVQMVSVSGVDPFHKGLESEEAREELQTRLTRLFEDQGFSELPPKPERDGDPSGSGPHYHFFGAQPGSWIGKLWPRGRAEENGLSSAGLTENFCNRWSGGLNFLQYQYSGSEVSVDPEGNVFPCCIKTRKPVGNLREEELEAMLERLQGDPMYEAISMGHPERMGIHAGWSLEKFLQKSRRRRPDGRIYQNFCVGCDAFHEEVLMAGEGLVKLGE